MLNYMLTFAALTYFKLCTCDPGGHDISGDLPQKVQLQTPCKTGERIKRQQFGCKTHEPYAQKMGICECTLYMNVSMKVVMDSSEEKSVEN